MTKLLSHKTLVLLHLPQARLPVMTHPGGLPVPTRRPATQHSFGSRHNGRRQPWHTPKPEVLESPAQQSSATPQWMMAQRLTLPARKPHPHLPLSSLLVNEQDSIIFSPKGPTSIFHFSKDNGRSINALLKIMTKEMFNFT